MSAILLPREAGKFITENSKDVFVEQEGVRSLAKTLFDKVNKKEITLAGWKSLHELNPQDSGEDAVNWVFFADTLNFSFWSDSDEHKYLVKYKGKEYSGYWSFCAAMNRALDEGIPITTPSYYSNITLDQLKHVLRSDSDVPIPMIEERLQILHQTGKILTEKFGGSYLNCVKQSDKSAVRLMKLIVENFPSYKDVGIFQGKQVAFYKRVQILVGDTWGVLGGQGDGNFYDIHKITMFADYRIPQALVHFGTMRYSDELMKKLKEAWLFQNGDIQEMEIRGCSIWAVELICEHMRELFKEKGEEMSNEINPVLIDHFLWDYARDYRKEINVVPFHRVRCIYY
ncbi:queuosine salvage protein [Bombina bombina]|uniref:queuosine salvage protein n=1 Tax=Bombina bombina TaxID=8345 RepID=UPI00235B0E97|nr:queuosine salvage protein [Bombina bombina]XP_053554686.1 queuosine salvage protein [Bombina bombina]XP_053554687.1 queuosine salvage protein [Bombina bombina]XP_053554688.1 queuosine salvage protein [Bombina bombina]XP_053554689.1 queuosine salvage protein [Bombina bombina]XP_053554690.1 queuosine salvage protein [Bombina bombina]